VLGARVSARAEAEEVSTTVEIDIRPVERDEVRMEPSEYGA
jgi:hypothetical protein